MKWNPGLYDGKHAFVSAYGRDVLDLLDPQPGQSILDLGCGTGHLTQLIADSGAKVLGIDASEEMIEQARTNHPTIDFRVADGAQFRSDTPFDAIFSNAALHWIEDAEGCVACMAENLKEGGRLVAEFGGKGNIETIAAALEQALHEEQLPSLGVRNYFPSIAEYSSLLEKYNLEPIYVALIDRPTQLDDGERGLSHWISMFRRGLIEPIPESKRTSFFQRIESRVRDRLWRDEAWWADYRRLRLVAIKRT